MTKVDMRIKRIEEETAGLVKVRAAARGWTVAHYIEQLVALHGTLQGCADMPNAHYLASTLRFYGLESVQA